MLTFFSTPKPFVGHIGIIQRNAIQSWLRLHPHVEIILFGDDLGTAEVCQELRIRHVTHVAKNRYGTKYLASIFDQAQEIAVHDVLCYANCDILLMSDFRQAVESVTRLQKNFLMAGRRWDADICEPVDFKAPDWEKTLRKRAVDAARQRPPQWMDYFVFDKGLYYRKIPGFVIGRPGWDPWLLWYALHSGVRLVDASAAVCAVHQNHDYSYHPDGEKGVWEGEEAQENYRLLENWRKYRTLESATHVLRSGQLCPNHARWLVAPKRHLRTLPSRLWHLFLKMSLPLRHRLGLKREGFVFASWRRWRARRQ